MTAAEADDSELTALWAPGSAVVILGEGLDGAESLAVWQVSPVGAPTGAWVLSQAEVFGSPEVARRVLSTVERRGITAPDPATVPEVLERLSVAAGLGDAMWWHEQVFSAVAVFGEIAERRLMIEATVKAARLNNKSITALEWERDFPADVEPKDFDELRRLARIVTPPGSPVVAEALTVARVLRWLVTVWAETEQVKARRHYVRAKHGAPEALPPSWLDVVQGASATRLAL